MLGQVAGEVKFEASCVLGSDRLAMNVDCTYLLGDPGKWFPHSFFICNVGIVNPPPPPPSDCCIHHRRSFHRWSPLEAAAPGGSEGPWWEQVGESPPRPCSTLTLPVPVSFGPRCQQKEVRIPQIPGKELFGQSQSWPGPVANRGEWGPISLWRLLL